MLTNVSMLNKSIFPRMRSEIRGWVTPTPCLPRSDEFLHLLVPLLAELDVRRSGAFALLLEAVQDTDRVTDAGDIEDAVGIFGVADPDLAPAL
jgi:hypothetical protein